MAFRATISVTLLVENRPTIWPGRVDTVLVSACAGLRQGCAPLRVDCPSVHGGRPGLGFNTKTWVLYEYP